ncbi:MAG: GNAT family N-acetyltransferase [Solirubrobacteraceae bacterium]|nr:GNAT family N-acetyltransferase [Solirubrobacteraceae bacterium]
MPEPAPLPTLVGAPPDLVLRPSDPSDVDELLDLLRPPEIAEWWGENDAASLTDEIAGHFTIVIGGEVAGILECHQENEPMYPEVSFDIMLGVRWHGAGYGRRALRLAIDYFVTRGHHRFAIDPAATNVAAIRCYSAVGFRPVGILRQAERTPRGEFRDGLLMDLLATELP